MVLQISKDWLWNLGILIIPLFEVLLMLESIWFY